MSIAFVTFNIFNGTAPITSTPYTPGTGNQIYILGFDNSTGTGTILMSGSATTLTNNSVVGPSPCTGGCLNFGDGHADTYSLWSALSAAAGSQSFTVSQPAGDSLAAFQLEFSGGVSTQNATYATTPSPGAGTGAVVGTAVTVASGDFLTVMAFNSDAFGDAPTLNGPAGSTPITSYGNVAILYWVGTGASITPTFTAAAGEGGNPHQVVQWVVSASGGPPPGGTAPFTPFRRTVWFVTDTVIQS
jgi:hypothetical protein